MAANSITEKVAASCADDFLRISDAAYNGISGIISTKYGYLDGALELRDIVDKAVSDAIYAGCTGTCRVIKNEQKRAQKAQEG